MQLTASAARHLTTITTLAKKSKCECFQGCTGVAGRCAGLPWTESPPERHILSIAVMQAGSLQAWRVSTNGFQHLHPQLALAGDGVHGLSNVYAFQHLHPQSTFASCRVRQNNAEVFQVPTPISSVDLYKEALPQFRYVSSLVPTPISSVDLCKKHG